MTRGHESVSVTLHEGGLVRIRTTRLRRGVNVGGDLWLGLDTLPWLAEAVSRCAEELISSETQIGPDSLRVRVKGHELDPQVGIGNVRVGPVERAGRYFIAIREAWVSELVEQLRRLSAGES